jgi:hypothetical protein
MSNNFARRIFGSFPGGGVVSSADIPCPTSLATRHPVVLLDLREIVNLQWLNQKLNDV